MRDEKVMGRFRVTRKEVGKLGLGRFLGREGVMEMCLEMLWRSGDELDYADFTKDERM